MKDEKKRQIENVLQLVEDFKNSVEKEEYEEAVKTAEKAKELTEEILYE